MVSADLLEQFEFFKGFSKEHIKKLADIAVEKSFGTGVQIWKKGDPAGTFYILQEGKVVMLMEAYMGPHRPPMQVTVDVVTKGDAMGWSTVVEPHQYVLGARCIDDSKAIAFDAEKLREIMKNDVLLGLTFMHAIAKVIAARLTHTEIILVGERGLATLTEL
jgi:CRP-like cAMP-binding protein